MPPKQRKQASFTEYLPDVAVREGVRNGTYLIGLHHIPQRWTNDRSYVRNSDFFPRDVDICIANQSDRNRAFDGDIVVVEITGSSDKQAKTDGGDLFACQSETCFADDPDSNGDDQRKPRKGKLWQICTDYGMVSDLEWEENTQPVGKIVAVIEQKPVFLIGTALPNDSPRSFVKVTPYDAKLPRCMVPIRQIPKQIQKDLEKHLLLVKLCPEKWTPKHNLPDASFVKSLGYTGTVEAETSAILSDLHVEERPFSDEVMESIIKDIPIPPLGTNTGARRDLRESEFVCSIDPATARDLDDALSIRKLTNGHFLVGVHIADVSEYVPEGSAADVEAVDRGSSIYLCQRVIPMLPPELSESKCSLNTDGDKLAFSVMWELDRRGHVVPDTQWIGKSIIRNRCKLAYEDAQLIILEDPSVDDRLQKVDEATRTAVKKSVSALWKLADQIRTRRFASGSIALDQPKLSFITTDNDSALAPIDYCIQKQSHANYLVEEFMLLANKSVAEKIYSSVPREALLRAHEKPNTQTLKFYKGFLKSRGIEISIASEAEFAHSIRASADHALSAYISILFIRSFRRAKYVMAPEEEKKAHHFALNMNLYTHFTSPIRRYADLYVHRLLSKILQCESQKSHEKNAVDFATDVDNFDVHLNERQDRARAASERSLDLFLCLYLENLRKVAIEKGETGDSYRSLPARIIKIRRSSILVYVHDIADCVEIPFRSKRQLWSSMEQGEENISVRVCWKDLPVDSNTAVDTLAKDFKASLKLVNDKIPSTESTDTPEFPTLSLFDQLFVSLVVRDRSPLELDAIIHPPDYHGKPLPVSLLNDLRSK